MSVDGRRKNQMNKRKRVQPRSPQTSDDTCHVMDMSPKAKEEI